MDLAYRDLGGQGPLLVFLHGLFGSSQNWAGMGRRLGGLGRCILIDLRNHGDSPHASEHSLAACVQDIADWANLHAAVPLTLIGHSMGGLIAMGFAIAHPDHTAGVASLDIAPRSYPPEHEAEFRALHADISLCRSRTQLDEMLKPLLPNASVRQFILTNAVRDDHGFRWRLNVKALESSTVRTDFATVEGRYDGPALLAAGGKSSYVTKDDLAVMHRYFPAAVLERIAQADHWLHVSAPEALGEVLSRFLRGPVADAIKERGSRL
jgi:pimeloyl-ACP methyl ester carboxylesterase